MNEASLMKDHSRRNENKERVLKRKQQIKHTAKQKNEHISQNSLQYSIKSDYNVHLSKEQNVLSRKNIIPLRTSSRNKTLNQTYDCIKRRNEWKNEYFKMLSQQNIVNHKVIEENNSMINVLVIDQKAKLSKSQLKHFNTLPITFSEIRGIGPTRFPKWGWTTKRCTNIYNGNVRIISEDLSVPHGLLLKNHLSEKALVGLKIIALSQIYDKNVGWNKGGAVSGPVIQSDVNAFSNSLMRQQSYGVKNASSISHCSVSGTHGSARLHYTNQNGKPCSFQFGAYLKRNIYKNSSHPIYKYLKIIEKYDFWNYIKEIIQYFDEIHEIYHKYAYDFMDDISATYLREHKDSCKSKFVVNEIHTNDSKINIHMDAPSYAPVCLTSINPFECEAPYDGGDFVFIEGGIIVPYKNTDVLLINGRMPHAVTKIIPRKGCKGCTRISCSYTPILPKVIPGASLLP